MLKRCPRCKETKSLDQYHYSSTNKNNVQGYCKICMNQLDKKKRERYRSDGPTISRTHKTCAKCKTEKIIFDFPVSIDKPDGRLSYCKKCWTEYVKSKKS